MAEILPPLGVVALVAEVRTALERPQRRRCDGTDPWPGVLREQLTPQQRVVTQGYKVERYCGRLDRRQWLQRYWRERGTAIIRTR